MSNEMISCFHIRCHTKATFPLKIPNKRQGLPDIIAGRPEFTGAGNEIRTRDPRLGKPNSLIKKKG